MTISETIKEQSEFPLIAVIDLGAGNLHSVLQALRMVAPKHRVVLTTSPDVVNKAERVVLPGQGAMLTCMQSIRERDLEKVIRLAISSKPVFAICVGLQLFFEYSDEGDVPGLGVIPGRVRHLANLHTYDSFQIVRDGSNSICQHALKIPHMGWSQVRVCTDNITSNMSHPIWNGLGVAPYFYFAHSFYVEPDPTAASLVIGKTDYPSSFASVVAFNDVVATQFHPEKSGENGLRFLKNFIEWKPR